jgi:photosystem II stability/assembly factor-like uncharacterized protein
MRPSRFVFALSLVLELLIWSCATRKSPTAALLPKTLAQLRPGNAGPLELHPSAQVDADDDKDESSFAGVKPDKVVMKEPEADDQEAADAEQDGTAESEEFLRHMRMPGGGSLDPQRYLSARRHAEAMRHYSISEGRFVTDRGGLKADSLSAPKDLASSGWVSLGPGNVGGRTRSILINPQNPNIMYLGSVTGGVWKSTDAGTTWAPLTDLVPTDYVSAMVMSPTDPNTIYAGTGEGYLNIDARRGLGILKTTDGGATWTRLPSTANSNFYYVTKLLITPGGNLYASTWNGVFRSPDGGNTWIRSLSMFFCYEMAARPDQPEYVFANCSTTNSSGGPFAIFRNVAPPSGASWDNVFAAPNMARTSLAIAPSQPTTIYAMSWSTNPQPTTTTGLIGVFRSLSSGDTGSWTTQTSNQDTTRLNTALLSYPGSVLATACGAGANSYSGQGWYDNVLTVDPVNPNRVWAGGIDIFRSDDGGANWGMASYWNRSPGTEYAHADRHVIVFHPNYDGVSNQTLFIGTDGGLFRTDNANAAVATGPTAPCAPNKTDIVWTNLNHRYTVTQYNNGRPYPGGTAYMGGAQDNGTTRGTDATGPEAWYTVGGGDGGWVAIDPVDPNAIIFEFTNLSTSRSTNGGASTSDATHGITESSNNFQFYKNIAMDAADAQRLYVGGKTLWRTIDGAKSWTEASVALSDTISAISVSPSDPNTLMFSGTSGAIYYGNNALRSDRTTVWASSIPRMGATAAAIAFDPTNPQVVFAVYPAFKTAATDNHVYKSVDGGQTWTGIDGTGTTGLPDVPVNVALVDPSNNQTIYIGTDLGIYVSLDGGTTWARDVNPFVDTPVTTLTIDKGTGTSELFAFTYGRGAWKVPLTDGGTACTYSVDQTNLTSPAEGPAIPSTYRQGPAVYGPPFPLTMS